MRRHAFGREGDRFLNDPEYRAAHDFEDEDEDEAAVSGLSQCELWGPLHTDYTELDRRIETEWDLRRRDFGLDGT